MIAVDLSGRAVAVTGGFGTLGASVGRCLADAGAQVALLDRSAAVTPAASGITGAFLLGAVDLGVPEACRGAVEQLVQRFGRVDALVNVAGGFRWEKVEGGSVDTWDLLYQMNLRTAVNMTQAALPHLLASAAGRVVNVGAGAAVKAGTGMGAYAASKAGVARFTEALAEELKDRNVTVNAVLPSIIDTAPNRADMPTADFSRWVKPEEIAVVIAFLLSDHARAITGALIPVSGRV
jgi:NAD(P)-dependent dehydrogenase (short-subunit alcohol dehydrogenase family)